MRSTVPCRRLLSEDPGVVAKSLSFVKDVLLQDFPPELLLQRPAVLKVTVHTLTHLQTPESSFHE